MCIYLINKNDKATSTNGIAWEPRIFSDGFMRWFFFFIFFNIKLLNTNRMINFLTNVRQQRLREYNLPGQKFILTLELEKIEVLLLKRLLL